MNGNLRSIVISCLLGLLTAYVIWGHRSAPPPADERREPTFVAATTNTTPTPTVPSATGSRAPEAIAEDAMHGLTDLRFEPEALDFGSVPVGEARVKAIVVRNPTDHTINVKELHPSCHCIEVKMAHTAVLPGHAEPIEVTFHALPNRKDSTVKGYFKTDEKGTPDVAFKVHAFVKQEIVIEPSIAQFERGKKHEVATKDVTVKSADGQPFALKSVKGTHPEFTYTWAPAPNSNSSVYTVTVSLLAAHNGPLHDEATVMTDRANAPGLALYISATIAPELSSAPPIVAADLQPGGHVGKFVAELRHTVPGRLEIRGVIEGLDPKYRLPVKYDVERVSDEAVKLTIELTEAFPMRTPFGQFMIKTNVEEDDYRLPYRVNGAPTKPNFPGVN
jgi:hypothetical protein